MNPKMSHALTSALLMSGLAFAEDAASPKVEFTGMLDADVVGTYDKDNKKISYQANHEADLVANAKFSEKTSIFLGLTSYTTGAKDEEGNSITNGATPGGGTPANDASHWDKVSFDGIWASHEFGNGLKLTGGDFAVTEGAFSYYGYKRTRLFASVMSENYFRGVGVDFMGASLYAGADDAADSTTEVYAAYTLEAGPATVHPFAFYSTNMDGITNVKAGLTGDYSFGPGSVKATYGFVKDDGMDPSHTIKVEGSVAFGKISVAGTAYYAITSDEKPSALSVPEEAFYYVEPDYAFSDLISAGPALELHTFAKDVDDSQVWILPNLYINPAAGMQFVFWAGPTIYLGDNAPDPTISLGSELIASF